ncbi:hypothetical protein D3C80_1816810 [compost metagenome]
MYHRFIISDKHDEFIASQSGSHADWLCNSFDYMSNVLQHLITYLMTVLIIYVLKVIEVNEQNRQRLPAVLRILNRILQLLIKESPVRKLC